jgi:predicted ATPase
MIRHLHVENFKSIKELDIDLGAINVLVGANMAGKSNLVEVFRFLNRLVLPSGGAYGLSNAVMALGGFWEMVWKGADSNLVSLQLKGDLPGTDQISEVAEWDYGIKIVADQQGYNLRVQDEYLTFTNGSKRSELVRTEGGVRKLLRPDGREVSQLSEPARSALEFEIPDWEANPLRFLFSSIQFHRVFPPAMKQINQMAGEKFLREHGENLSSWLMTLQTTHRESFVRIEAVMKDAFPGIESLFTVPTQQSTVFLSSKEKYLRRPVTSLQMSDGELTFLGYLSLLLSPDELGAPLQCVEEPENHLHPKLLEILVEILRQEHGARLLHERSQVLLTTHSPSLVDQFKLDELLVIEKRKGATVCTRPRDKKQLKELLENKEVGLGDLFYSGALSDAQ